MKYSKVISADWLYIISLRGSAGHSENESRKYGNGFETRVTIRQNWPLSLFEAQIKKILPGHKSDPALLRLRSQKLQIRGWVISDRFTNCKDIDVYVFQPMPSCENISLTKAHNLYWGNIKKANFNPATLRGKVDLLRHSISSKLPLQRIIAHRCPLKHCQSGDFCQWGRFWTKTMAKKAFKVTSVYEFNPWNNIRMYWVLRLPKPIRIWQMSFDDGYPSLKGSGNSEQGTHQVPRVLRVPRCLKHKIGAT